MICPTDPPPPSDQPDVIGCGSTNVAGPDHEGFYDCLDCGIWFKPEEAILERRNAGRRFTPQVLEARVEAFIAGLVVEGAEYQDIENAMADVAVGNR